MVQYGLIPEQCLWKFWHVCAVRGSVESAVWRELYWNAIVTRGYLHAGKTQPSWLPVNWVWSAQVPTCRIGFHPNHTNVVGVETIPAIWPKWRVSCEYCSATWKILRNELWLGWGLGMEQSDTIVWVILVYVSPAFFLYCYFKTVGFIHLLFVPRNVVGLYVLRYKHNSQESND